MESGAGGSLVIIIGIVLTVIVGTAVLFFDNAKVSKQGDRVVGIDRGHSDQNPNTGIKWTVLGWVFIAAAVALIAWGISFDTSVPTHVGRVENLGLLHDRQIIFIAGFFAAIVGFGCHAAASFLKAKK